MNIMTDRKKKPKAGAKSNPWPARLKAIRERYKLTQTEAAARVRISQSQWSAFESGARTPTRPIAHLIELVFPN